MMETRIINVTVPEMWWTDEKKCWVDYKTDRKEFGTPNDAINYAFKIGSEIERPVKIIFNFEGGV